jgi:chromosome segregation ATPase
MRKHHPKNEQIKRNHLAYREESTTSLLDKADATALTQRIRTAVDGLWTLLLEAHDHKAWKALGYATWAAYVQAEFDMSRRHSYRLLDQGRIIRAIEDVTGENVTHGSQITERDARDLKPDLPALTGEIKARVEAGEDPQKAAAETIAAKKAAKEKAKAEKKAQQAKHDREREEHLAKLPEAVKQQQAAKEAAIEAKKGKSADADEGLSDADRIEELEEAVRVLEAENAALKAENKHYGDMKVQWASGGYEKVIADKDGVIRVLEGQVYRENEDKVSWMRSANYWKAEAIRLGWSNEAVIDVETGEMING